MSATTTDRTASTPIADLLAGRVPVGQAVSIAGWVRTRRDSKAGMSFINVHDGSCFDAIQVVAPNTLENYEGEVAAVISQVLPLQRSYWVVLTVGIILKPDYGSVFARAVQRGVGTVVGAVPPKRSR